MSDLDPTPETVRRLLIWYEYNGVPVPETQEMLLVQAHRERMNASGIDEDKREESRTWLRERGYLPRE